MATLMANERASYIVILSYLPLPVFRPRPVEFGRQPPEGVRAFQWLQYSTVCLCCEVGMACFGAGFFGMERGRRNWTEYEAFAVTGGAACCWCPAACPPFRRFGKAFDFVGGMWYAGKEGRLGSRVVSTMLCYKAVTKC